MNKQIEVTLPVTMQYAQNREAEITLPVNVHSAAFTVVLCERITTTERRGWQNDDGVIFVRINGEWHPLSLIEDNYDWITIDYGNDYFVWYKGRYHRDAAERQYTLFDEWYHDSMTKCFAQ